MIRSYDAWKEYCIGCWNLALCLLLSYDLKHGRKSMSKQLLKEYERHVAGQPHVVEGFWVYTLNLTYQSCIFYAQVVVQNNAMIIILKL